MLHEGPTWLDGWVVYGLTYTLKGTSLVVRWLAGRFHGRKYDDGS